MRFLIGNAIIAIGVGTIMALIRYYTTIFALKYIRGRLRVIRKAGRA
jgi:uncharacterized membrane protein